MMNSGVISIHLCCSVSITGPGGLLGSRGVGEGAEAEEPAVSKGGEITLYHPGLKALDTYIFDA